jgi:hypothetical protein
MEKMIKRTEKEHEYKEKMGSFFSEASGSIPDKLNNFTRFVDRQTLATFLYKYELFKKVLDVQGSVLEFGVFRGGGSFAFAQLSTILEPYNYQRRVIGFDTFEGFPAISEIDDLSDPDISPQKGDFSTHEKFYEELMQNIGLFNMNRFLNNVEKLMFVKGDINITLSRFLEENKHIVVSLAYFDLDIYSPTKLALELVLSRMPKGGIIAFDELNNPDWPGETVALIETCGINNLRLKRFMFEPCRSYCVVE